MRHSIVTTYIETEWFQNYSKVLEEYVLPSGFVRSIDIIIESNLKHKIIGKEY